PAGPPIDQVMRSNIKSSSTAERGYALLLTLVLTAIFLVIMTSMCQWASSSSVVTARNNSYNTTLAAAEAATEAVIAQMENDFVHQTLSGDANTYAGV